MADGPQCGLAAPPSALIEAAPLAEAVLRLYMSRPVNGAAAGPAPLGTVAGPAPVQAGRVGGISCDAQGLIR